MPLSSGEMVLALCYTHPEITEANNRNTTEISFSEIHSEFQKEFARKKIRVNKKWKNENRSALME